MSKSILLSFSAAVLLSGAALAAEPANLPENVVVRHTDVAFGDLDLNSEAGVAALVGRLQVASKAVCGPLPSGYGAQRTYEDSTYKSCKQGAVADALSKLGGKVPAAYRTAAK